MANANYQVSGNCPVCGEHMFVTRLECGNCQSALEGRFNLGPFQNLTAEQLQFLEVFIRSRGQNKAIQDLLNISYPTVNKKLNELIVALGYEPDSQAVPETTPALSRREVLEMLSQGKINALQAQQLLANVNSNRPIPDNTEKNNENQMAVQARASETGE